MMRARSYAVTTTIAAALIALSACGTTDTDTGSTSSAGIGITATSDLPAPETTPYVTVACSTASGADLPALTYDGDPDFTEAWKQDSVSCMVERNEAPLSDLETAAAEKAGTADVDTVKVLYGLCSSRRNSQYDDPAFTVSDSQTEEIRGMLTLCPGHPEVKVYRASIRRGQEEAKMRADGRIFGEGVHLVGKEVQPGTYVSEGELHGCYWERTDDAGEIIDNNFINAARRAEVTISSSDYSFSSENCGEWRAE